MEQVNSWHTQFPPGTKAAGSHNICQYFFCFPSFYAFVPSHSPHHRKRQREGWKAKEKKREEKLSRKALFKTLGQDYLEALKSRCSLQFPPFPSQDGAVPGGGRHSPLVERAQWLRATRHPSSARRCILPVPDVPSAPRPGLCP